MALLSSQVNAIQALGRFPCNDDITLSTDNSAFLAAKQLSKFRIKGAEYVREEEVATAGRSRSTTSLIWRFGEAIVRCKDGVRMFYCYDCERKRYPQKLPVLKGTSNVRKHLEDVHKRNMETGEIREPEESVRKSAVWSYVSKTNYDHFKHLVVRWFAFCQLALFMVENTFFREVVTYLNTGLGSMLPRASSTLRRWIMDEFEAQKKLVTAELSKSISRVHISFDIWTAGNWVGFLSVYGYWIDLMGCRQRRLLAFRRIYGSHSGENQADVLEEVLQSYGLDQKVGYFVSDNASSNSLAVKYLLQAIQPGIADAASRRLRCLGHSINLAAQALLAGGDPECGISSGTEVGNRELWNKKWTEFEIAARSWIHTGPLGKLQRVVQYVLASGKRREEFGEIKGGRKVEEFDHLCVI